VFGFARGARHNPPATVAVRADSAKPFISSATSEGVFGPQASAAIIAQLKSGGRVATRYTGWPYENAVDNDFELHGFNQAFQYVNWAVKRIK